MKQQLVLAEQDTGPTELDSVAIRRHWENVTSLQAILEGDADPSVIAAFRDLIAGVIVMPRDRGDPYTVQIVGHQTSSLKGIPLVRL